MFGRNARSVDPREAKDLLDRGVTMIDVREVSEWNQGHAPRATHIPLDSLAENLHRIPRDEEVLVCCRSGSRSSSAVSFLVQRGYRPLNLNGGMSSWDAHGLPVVNSRGTRGAIA